MTPADAILIVDDSRDSAVSLELALAAIPGLTVIAVSSVTKALDVLSSRANRIRAVVTDIQMPGINGFDFIGLLRADPAYRKVPVVVVTGDTDPDTPERSSALGANAFFAKPCSLAAVRRKVECLLNADL